jgi:anti-sigma regulatory factor (Ser/Thr protein kinase)
LFEIDGPAAYLDTEKPRPMTSDGTHLRHSALVYESPDEYVERSVAFLKEGFEAGEGAVVVTTRSTLAAVREGLGSDAEQATFVDAASAYTRPARTLAACHLLYAEQLRRTPALRSVADIQFGPDAGEWHLWVGFESVFNRCFAHLPAWVVCAYNANLLADPVLESVGRTHPEVFDGDTWRPSDHFEDPADLLRATTPEPEVLRQLRPVPFGTDVESFREHLARELAAEQVPEAKAFEMLFAATEVAENARAHGGGIEAVRIARVRGRFVCEVVDRGSGFSDPAAGYLAPRTGRGSGLWVARQLTWNIEFFDSPAGFTARIWL